MIELVGRVHWQINRAKMNAIRRKGRIRSADQFARNRRDSSMNGDGLVDVPGIKSGISSDIGRELIESKSGVLIEWVIMSDIAAVEGEDGFGEDHVAIVGRVGCCHARFIFPEMFFALGFTPTFNNELVALV